jgi:hypothetical protein
VSLRRLALLSWPLACQLSSSSSFTVLS